MQGAVERREADIERREEVHKGVWVAWGQSDQVEGELLEGKRGHVVADDNKELHKTHKRDPAVEKSQDNLKVAYLLLSEQSTA